MDPGGRPDYFGQAPNHANSQLPTGGASVSIADVTGTAATASATVEKGPVVGVTVDNGGRGYTGSPTISFGGNGAGAKAHAVVVGGVTGVVVTAGGSNYSSGAPPAVTFSAPTSAAGTLAKGTVLIDQTGAVPGIQIDDAGSGYVAGKVTATITDASAPAGQGATVTASVSGTIESIVADGGGGGYAPEANELGRKDAVLMHPLEDTIVALRPQAPTLPPKIPNSVRSIDPTVPANANIATFDPKTGQTITVKNAVVDYGWEYVWHCHMLSHEELDFMGR